MNISNSNINNNTNPNTSNNNAIMIMTGGPSREVMTTEATVMKVMALHQGVPTERIFVEDQSVDTIENAMFAKSILDKTNIKKVYYITHPATLVYIS